MTSKPDSVSTLGYHWTDHTGRPLEPQVHWDATGTTLDDASTQWCSSGDPVLICIIGTHWKTTGQPLEDHWKTTGSTLTFLQWHSSVHWGQSSRHTGLPLEDHWLRVRESITQTLIKMFKDMSMTQIMFNFQTWLIPVESIVSGTLALNNIVL